ncbi:hypothetical protein AWN76_008185 [Rhodothermaceae bacterium RA]|nr:hypothetical protein AWN76_008185 [Rhodothermaceae bacterium RA]
MRVSRTLLLVVLAALLLGCEEDVAGPDPFQYPYSMWGVLNPLADTQFVRVFPIEPLLEPGRPEPLDVRFTSLDLDTGEERLWRDSVFVDSTGQVGHVFYAPFRVAWDHRYRVTITRDDGAATWAEVHIPERALLILEEPDTTREVILPARIEGEARNLIQSEVEIYVSYVVGFSPPPIAVPIFAFYRHYIPFDTNLRRTVDGWTFAINLTRSYYPVFGSVTEDSNFIVDEGIRLLTVTFRTVVADDAWMPPGGVFDPNVLIQPGTMSNVENGFGFIGGGYELSRSWTLPFEVVEQTDYLPNR